MSSDLSGMDFRIIAADNYLQESFSNFDFDTNKEKYSEYSSSPSRMSRVANRGTVLRDSLLRES